MFKRLYRKKNESKKKKKTAKMNHNEARLRHPTSIIHNLQTDQFWSTILAKVHPRLDNS